jgi:predicted amino acid-binding ACT domain protein
MPYTINKVDVWAGDILNRSGMLARVIEALTNAGAQLEFMIARRVNDKTSRVFFAPIKGAKQHRAASDVGLVRASGMHSLRIEGSDRAGLGAAITRAVADKGINLRGASAAAIGKKAVFYLAVESEQNLREATRVVRKFLRK